MSNGEDYDSDAPEELTAEQGVQQDQELNKLQKEHKARLCARVAVFQVFVSNSTDNPVVTAVLEAVEEYDIHDFTVGDYTVYSTFIMYDCLDKDDTKADVTNSTLSGLDSRRGVGKHAAEFFTDADMHKKPKTTLC